ncbi:unnamed protein product [Rotaria socialis]|uniref:Arrestin C-terminal-like domain-containing protein n=1 Tax=Rotaria socialis TaxID=392032 RepID=A0A818JLD6_9BILA|nr:unnamed protein product [Rotaria socialis]CAF3349956.1 unnamed protein product [Rotaria socialis]CAF3367185.1 unnamed protein product [Rotaria socialis]CAF3544019.1 unnamed protein product [Rotaria socialis]CAF4153958.1 unnamed protein product [Rotaria socialis]
MGTCSSVSVSNISVRLDDTGKNAYYTGDTISGVIEFTNTDPTELKFDKITGVFAGKCVYVTRRHIRNGEEITIHTLPLFSAPLIPNSINDLSQRTLSPGKHTWPFSFTLPQYLPPSITEQTTYGQYIKYYIHIEIIRSEIYRRNIEKTLPFFIQHSSSIVAGTRIEDKKNNRNGVCLRAYFENNIAILGTYCTLHLEVDNPNASKINRISTELIQSRKFSIAAKEELTVMTQEMPDSKKLKGKQVNTQMNIILPATLPATYSFYPAGWSNGRKIAIDYWVHIELHLSGFFTNIELDIPIILAAASLTSIDAPPKQESIPLPLENMLDEVLKTDTDNAV